MRVLLAQIDGSMPNIALMKLSHWHKARGDEVTFTTDVKRDLFAGDFDKVYGSAIFKFSQARLMQLQRNWPEAIVGGTGTPYPWTVEEITGEYEHYDYSIYPDVAYSLGFTQRGCRLKCKFCVVPEKEGKPRSVNTIESLWRGAPWPKQLHILDNDFFGNPDWRARIDEIKAGDFRVCLSQGINVRLINDEAAAAIASIQYRDTKFTRRRLYTAWDNLRDERVFFRGVDMLEAAGIPSSHLMVYMLVGYDETETWARIWHRFNAMVARGIRPYPMVFDRARKDLTAFQRWVVTGLYRACRWPDFESQWKTTESIKTYLEAA